MKHFLHPALRMVPAFCALACLSSCIDDKYDLSDIDTTTQLKVEDLTIPVNLKAIKLDKMIDLDEDNPDALIKVRKIGDKDYYVLSKGGSFEAETNLIKPIEAPKPEVQEETSIRIMALSGIPVNYIDYKITPHNTTFTYNVGQNGSAKVDDAIISVADVSLSPNKELNITLAFSSRSTSNVAKHMEIHDLVLELPDGASGHYGNIAASNGTITIPSISTTNGILSVKIAVSKLDFTSPTAPNGIEVKNGEFDYSGHVGVRSGTLRIYPDGGSTSVLPEEIDFTTRYDLSAFTVSGFSGVFDYAVDFNDISDLDLSDVPEFLAGEQTDIKLVDPALSLDITAPIATYGLNCATGITLTANRDGLPPHSEQLAKIEVKSGKTEQFIVVAPSEKALEFVDVPEDLTPDFTKFDGLANVLAGQGLPCTIGVSFSSAQYPKPHVFGRTKNFPLGSDFDQVSGEYNFMTPLALASGSRIVYTHTEDGWNDEDIDAIAITKLKIAAVATSQIPAGVKLYVRPIDVEGHRIPLTNADDAFITLPAGADNTPISLELLGDIRHLDGIYLEAVADDFSGTALSPDQTLTLTDIRATVSGTYTKKF